jgi:3-phenylpropionate/trans-cinnamate dioxygenase ferredoxin reductase component
MDSTARTTPRVVIVGGGIAAVRTAQALRDLGHPGEVTILSAEAEPPYDRPPLSKGHLLGTVSDDMLRLLTAAEYADLGIQLRLGAEAVGLDPAARTVTLADGSAVPYDRLVIATGSRARPLPMLAGRAGVLALRTADDSRRLAGVLGAGRSVAVVGGGFIGLEVTAAARNRGCAVTVVEAQAAPLVAAVGAEVAAWLRKRHEEHGVAFHCDTTVTAVADAPDGGERLTLADGSTVDAHAVVVGVGVVRDLDWLAAAGLEVATGLVCDVAGRTSLPDVFGAGDIVCHRTDWGTALIGHWTAAGDSAHRAAHAVLGLDPPTGPDDGFFWSDQYDLRLQFTGRIAHEGEFAVVAGDLDSGSFVARYGNGRRTTGVLAVNHPRGFLRERLALRKARSTAAEVSG